jgi:sec-independent protein translocase protein TatA
MSTRLGSDTAGHSNLTTRQTDMGNLGPTEIILILLVLVLLFGAKKLPELARGSGRALRIFKAETKGLMDDEDDKTKTEEQRQIDSMRVDNPPYVPPSGSTSVQPSQPTRETDH